jgi:hypothetical protein
MAMTNAGSKMTRARTSRDPGMGADGMELSGQAAFSRSITLPERFSTITPNSPENGLNTGRRLRPAI